MKVKVEPDFEIKYRQTLREKKDCVICGFEFESAHLVAAVYRKGLDCEKFVCPKCIKSLAKDVFYDESDWYDDMINHVSFLVDEVEKWDYKADFNRFKQNVDFGQDALPSDLVNVVYDIYAQVKDMLLIEFKDSFRKSIIENRCKLPKPFSLKKFE